ncbi:hypothetical protein psal_cds_692 [Pandoravirus salinus]|uniref:Uncharacterized protein n=1 Tax=Pandoravirus salinus TaxID=1349410 RepID=S4W2D8_9VIRU|nr:hypothetical protein psal_cds_692 [Pandoravirus salinus]AGO84637.1 hypothetical protein psal_cds_692 [Pandoravirus salinus]
MAGGWTKRLSHKTLWVRQKKGGGTGGLIAKKKKGEATHTTPAPGRTRKKMQRDTPTRKRKADDIYDSGEGARGAHDNHDEAGRRCRPRSGATNATGGSAPAIRHMVDGNLLAFADPSYEI